MLDLCCIKMTRLHQTGSFLTVKKNMLTGGTVSSLQGTKMGDDRRDGNGGGRKREGEKE